MIMPALLLQKPSFNSKTKENSEASKRRLHFWKNGQIDQLMFEGKTMKKTLQNNNRVSTNKSKEAITFARLIEKGKVNKAIKTLEKSKRGTQPLSDEKFEILQQKTS